MYPRAKAFGIAIHHGRLLVQEYHTGDETYYRPLGGSIELGEKSAHTVANFKKSFTQKWKSTII
ncbi:hypothetical protein III_00872 [Bacillus mycoides]|uniref:NUDIX hydrolase n=1 Tax=Bacillus mycoides TaxID=1405 RepID=A0ABC9R9X7_BACMY|nr:hypothetical protein III_00872 [Bacillus mycoides]